MIHGARTPGTAPAQPQQRDEGRPPPASTSMTSTIRSGRDVTAGRLWPCGAPARRINAPSSRRKAQRWLVSRCLWLYSKGAPRLWDVPRVCVYSEARGVDEAATPCVCCCLCRYFAYYPNYVADQREPRIPSSAIGSAHAAVAKDSAAAFG